MTKKLRAHSNQSVRVDVLYHDWTKPHADDAKYLQLDPAEDIISRVVVMLSDDIPVLYARTAIPKEVIENTGDELLKLDSRPIGEILFTDPNMKRSEFELALLKAGDDGYEEASNASGIRAPELWARRSQFELPNKGTIAITETFLPTCWQ